MDLQKLQAWLSTPHRRFDGSRRPCKCGTCKTCLENARWERIFEERFNDPEYYNRDRKQSPFGSSLGLERREPTRLSSGPVD